MAKFGREVFGLLILLFSLARAEEATQVDVENGAESAGQEAVLTLTPDNFTEVVNDKDLILVEFYAPWCGHCKQLAPEYEAAAVTLKQHDPPILLAKVDASAYQSLGAQYDVEGFPTMKVFRKGKAYDYEGPRKADGIVEYMTKQASADWKPPVDRVLVLTSENFTDTVTNSDLALVEFYAPWCGHCKKLAPEYSKAANILKDTGTDIILAKVDATVEKDLGNQYGVTGYPTLKIFRRGRVSEYKGQRNMRGIVEHMMMQARPATQEVSSSRDINQLLKGDRAFAVGFFENDKSSLFEVFLDVSNAGREEPIGFFHSFSPALAEANNVNIEKIVVFHPRADHSKYEPYIKPFEGTTEDKSPEEILAELKNLARPLVGFRSKENGPKLYTMFPLLTAYISLDDEEDSREFWKQKLVPVASKYRDMTFCLANEQDVKEELEALQLNDKGDNIFIGLWVSRTERYTLRFDDEFSSEELIEFLDDFKAGKLKPVLRSQPKPRKNDGPVKVVVGDTFNDIVFDSKKDVMVEFYAPWCGHCKQLEPKYKKLGKKFKDKKSIVIAKFDANNNDAPPQFEYSGFPTIFFVPAGAEIGSKPTLYEGAREVKDMAEFIKKEAVSLAKDEL